MPSAGPMEMPPYSPSASLSLWPCFQQDLAQIPPPKGGQPLLPSPALPRHRRRARQHTAKATPQGWPPAERQRWGSTQTRAVPTAPACAHRGGHAAVKLLHAGEPKPPGPARVCRAEAKPRHLTWWGFGLPGSQAGPAVDLAAILLEGLLLLQQLVDVLEELLHQQQHLIGGGGELLKAHLRELEEKPGSASAPRPCRAPSVTTTGYHTAPCGFPHGSLCPHTPHLCSTSRSCPRTHPRMLWTLYFTQG